MGTSLLKMEKLNKLFGETDVWHQRRVHLGMPGMVKSETSVFVPFGYHIFHNMFGKSYVQAILNNYLAGSVHMDSILEREILMPQLIIKYLKGLLLRFTQLVVYLIELAMGVAVVVGLFWASVLTYRVLGSVWVPVVIEIVCQVVSLAILILGASAAVWFMYVVTCDFIRRVREDVL